MIKNQLKIKAAVVLAASSLAASGRAEVTTVFDGFPLSATADRELVFDPTGTGAQLPVDWGLDTAWNSDANMIRGIRFITPECLSVARVSFNPYGIIPSSGELPSFLQSELDNRMTNVARIGHKVDIALNLDAARLDLMGDYYHIGTNGEGSLYVDWEHAGGGTKNHAEWARLIDATAAAVEAKGYTVVSAAPFNEPDYQYNGLTKASFLAINQELEKFPRFNNIRISGGNTLNCDEADPWYEYLKETLDEGNTHQLAGDFNHYAAFFEKVRNDGKYATADELHNVMEAMVGVEYGMQTGIWWGTAERVRGEFCQISNKGERLAYAENRPAWSAASVYKSPGKLQAFVGCSERQARPSTYRFVTTGGRALYADGYGPLYDYNVDVPADPNGGYMTKQQRTAEGVVDFTWGEDVQPELNGTYIIVNKKSGKAVTFSGKDGDALAQETYSNTNASLKWRVGRVSHGEGGDFSFWFINYDADENKSWNVNNFGLSDIEDKYDDSKLKVDIIGWPNNKSADKKETPNDYDTNMQWFPEYAGDGWFRIRSKWSNYCVRPRNKATQKVGLVQAPYEADDDSQLFRFIPVASAPSKFETTAPAAPTALTATASAGAVTLAWTAPADADVISYSLLRDNGDGQFNTIARNLSSTSIIDNTATPGVNYTYKVVAYDNCGNRSAASATAQAQPTGASSLWCSLPFDESPVDIKGNGFNARAAAFSYEEGHSGKGLRFRVSADAVQLPPTAAPAGQVFTVTSWVKMGSHTQAGYYLFDFGLDTDHHVGLRMSDGPSGNMAVVACNGGEEKKLTAKKVSVADWHHVAVVFNLNNWQLYVDGELAAEADEPDIHAFVPAEGKMFNFIGRGMRTYNFNSANSLSQVSVPALNGVVDNFRIYNFAISAQGVKEDMAGESSGIGSVMAETGAEVESVEYFNLKGQAVQPAAGSEPLVVRTRYTDGTVKTTKEVIR